MNKIIEALVKEGLDAKLYNISKPYIRIGYWNEIPSKILKLFPNLIEEEIYDEDCGYLYSYTLK